VWTVHLLVVSMVPSELWTTAELTPITAQIAVNTTDNLTDIRRLLIHDIDNDFR
jgi:hypothetical protein